MFKTLIDPSTLAPHVGDPDWVIIDCRFDLANPARGEELYREAHIPGARYAVLETGHYAPVQTPDLYARTIGEFLDAVGA